MMASSSSSFDRDSFEELSQDQDMNQNIHLKILEQPTKYFRYRYESEIIEGSHGFITGNSNNEKEPNKIYPTVELCNYSGDAVIKCSLVEWDKDEVHILKLSKESAYILMGVGPELGYKVVFSNLGIIKLVKSEVNEFILMNVENAQHITAKQLKTLYSKYAKNKARLRFTAHDPMDIHTPICPPVYSTVIKDKKDAATKNLKICRSSASTGSCRGGDVIFLLIDKVTTNDVGVRVYQLNAKQERTWSAECIYEKDDFHFQVAIVVKTPAYENLYIEKDVHVYIELYRKEEEMERSNRINFTYTPEIQSDCYRCIKSNVLHPLDPPIVSKSTKEYEFIDMNREPLLPNIHANNQDFADDYPSLQIQNDTIDSDMFDNYNIMKYDSDEFKKFASTFPHTKDYPGFEELEGDTIMGLTFEHNNLMTDGIVKKPKSKQYKTKMYMDPASDYEYSEEDAPPANWRPNNSEHNYCSTRPGGVVSWRSRNTDTTKVPKSSEKESTRSRKESTRVQKPSDKKSTRTSRVPKSLDNESIRTSRVPKSSDKASVRTSIGQKSSLKKRTATAKGQKISHEDTDEESLDSFNEASETDLIPRTSDVYKITPKVEYASDIDIEETGFDSYEDLEEDDKSNRSTPSIDIGTALERVTISTKKILPQKKSEDNNDSEIDSRLLDAIEKDDEVRLEDLLHEGLSPSVCDKNGNNAVHCAVKSKNCLPVLLKLCKGRLGDVINAWNNDTKTPLHLAASQNSAKKVELLMAHSARHDLLDDDGRSALHVAAAGGHLEVVETLLDRVPHLDVDQVDGKEQTALQIVCAGEDSPDNRAIVELLLEKKADALLGVDNGNSAMQLAKDKPKIMKILQTYVFC